MRSVHVCVHVLRMHQWSSRKIMALMSFGPNTHLWFTACETFVPFPQLLHQRSGKRRAERADLQPSPRTRPPLWTALIKTRFNKSVSVVVSSYLLHLDVSCSGCTCMYTHASCRLRACNFVIKRSRSTSPKFSFLHIFCIQWQTASNCSNQLLAQMLTVQHHRLPGDRF